MSKLDSGTHSQNATHSYVGDLVYLRPWSIWFLIFCLPVFWTGFLKPAIEILPNWMAHSACLCLPESCTGSSISLTLSMPVSTCPITFLATVPQKLIWCSQATHLQIKLQKLMPLSWFLSARLQPKLESGCSPLKTQWRGKVDGKERLLYFGCWQQGEGNHLSKVQLPPHPHPLWQSGARALTDRVRGLHAEIAQSALTVIFKLLVGLTNTKLIVLGTVKLQFQGRFVPISLRPMIRIVAG